MEKLINFFKSIWNFFFGNKEVIKDYGCQPISEHPDMDCAEPEIKQPQPETIRQNLMLPERYEGESFDHYRQRRRLVKQKIKEKLNGKLVFNSQNIVLDKTGQPKGFQFKKGRTFVNTKNK